MKHFIETKNKQLRQALNNTIDLIARLKWRHLLLFLLSVYCSPPLQAETEMRYQQHWPQIPQPWYFNHPRGIAVFQETVFIADTFNHRIVKYSQDGHFITSWGRNGNTDPGDFNYPHGLAIDQHGNVYVADTCNSRIQKFTGDGQYLMEFAVERRQNTHICETVHFNPFDIAVHSSGDILVSGENTLWKYSENGELITSFGSEGEQPGFFKGISGIALYQDQLFVIDSGNTRIQVLSTDGEFIKLWSSQTHPEDWTAPYDISISSTGAVYVSDFGNEKIKQFTADGQFVRTFSEAQAGDSGVSRPHSIAVNLQGQLFATDFIQFAQTQAYRILKYSENGQLISEWNNGHHRSGRFYQPEGVAIDDNGDVYVADAGNQRVQVFDNSGSLIREISGSGEWIIHEPGDVAVFGEYSYIIEQQKSRIIRFDAQGEIISWGSFGESDGQFFIPTSITADAQGHIYVADSSKDRDDSRGQRIQKFTRDGEFIMSWGGFSPCFNSNTGEKLSCVDGQFNDPAGIAIEDSEDGQIILVADQYNQRIQRFTTHGEFIDQFAVDFHPQSITVTENGYFAVPVSGSNYGNKIFHLNQSGKIINTLGEVGVNPGQFILPNDIAANKEGVLYISEIGNNRIQVFANKALQPGNGNQSSRPRKAIILAGGGPSEGNYINHIWDATQILAHKAYNALRNQGYGKDEIFYLSSVTQIDLDGNGFYDDIEPANLNNLQNALTGWAANAEDVVLYAIDHGGAGLFQVNSSELLSSTQLADWVQTLENQIPGKITLIIEACRSASFFPDLSAPDRILIASSDADQAAIISNKGLNAFSYFFWSEINDGATLESAFRIARQGMSSQIIRGRAQNAQLESNGDLSFELDDLNQISDICLGNCNRFASNAPLILNDNVNTQLNGETSTPFEIQVNSLEPIASAWAVVTRPDARHDNIDEPVDDLSRIPLDCTANSLCTGQYDDFNITGDFQVNFYVINSNQQISLPRTRIIKQSRADSAVFRPDSGVLTINDVEYLGNRYRVELLISEGFRFSLYKVEQLLTAITDPAARLDPGSNILEIPSVLAYDKNFQIKLLMQDGFEFQLVEANEIVSSVNHSNAFE